MLNRYKQEQQKEQESLPVNPNSWTLAYDINRHIRQNHLTGWRAYAVSGSKVQANITNGAEAFIVSSTQQAKQRLSM